MLSDVFDFPLQRTDAMPNLPAIHFEFCFTGTARSNTTAKPREVFSMSRQSRKTIRELREFDLQLAFFCSRSSAEKIKDQSGPVDDLGVECFFKVFCLTWRKLIIEDNNV